MQAIELTQQKIILPMILTAIAGLSTVIGSLIFFFIKRFKNSHLVLCLGLSSGAMIYISFAELLRLSIAGIGFMAANITFFIGMMVMMMIDFMIPHKYLQEREGLDPKHKKLYSTGVLIALGIAIHNLPEGLAVFLSGVTNIKLGIAFAIAIAIHNIPEGIAVSIPIYYSTKSKSRAFLFSFLSGVAEPIGAIIGLLLFRQYLTERTIAYFFAIVAGIMVFICFDELLPQVFKKDYHHWAISGILSGMLIMAISLSV